jgi:hypothetical protein
MVSTIKSKCIKIDEIASPKAAVYRPVAELRTEGRKK